MKTESQAAERITLRDKLHEQAEALGVPEHTATGLIEYIVYGIPTGGFLTAVLENNLKEAVGRADHLNGRFLFEICSFLYNHAPYKCWGSRESVRNWLDTFKEDPADPKEKGDERVAPSFGGY